MEGKEEEKCHACEKDDRHGGEEDGAVEFSSDDAEEEDTDAEFYDAGCHYIGEFCGEPVLGVDVLDRDSGWR